MLVSNTGRDSFPLAVLVKALLRAPTGVAGSQPHPGNTCHYAFKQEAPILHAQVEQIQGGAGAVTTVTTMTTAVGEDPRRQLQSCATH